MQSFTRENESSALETVFQATEDFISSRRDRDQDNQRRRKRKSCTASVFTSEWREAVMHFAKNLPMDLLIQQFNRFYPNYVRNNKRISVDKSGKTCNENNKDGVRMNKKNKSGKTCNEKNKDGEATYLPTDVVENILLRLDPIDAVVASRSISQDWGAFYDSKHFQDMHDVIEKCIVVNNHNLDMWAFSVLSKRWFLMKVPCDWDTLGMKTLGVKAGCSGLFLVARSDFTLFVVNPLTSRYKILPRIFPHTRKRIQFMKSLLIDGTSKMIVDDAETGSYRVFLFGNCREKDNSYVHLARYDSTTDIWKVEKIFLGGHIGLLCSDSFPGPLRSYRVGNVIVCFSATNQFFFYSCDVNVVNVELGYTLAREGGHMGLPAGIEVQNRHGEGEGGNSVTFPTTVQCIPGPQALIGRFKGNSNVGGVYGRLPIVSHSNLGIWKPDGLTGQWQLLKIIPVEFMQAMIETSEGTDFLVVGDGADIIWLMLRGSGYMLQYTISTGVSELQPGCPGGGYMDAHFRWKAVFEDIGFYATI